MSNFVKEVQDSTFSDEIENSDIPVIVDFWAPWCGPCKAVAPVFAKVAEKYDGKVKFAKVNVDENQASAAKFGVRSIPTFIVIKGGEVVNTIVGGQTEEQLSNEADKLL